MNISFYRCCLSFFFILITSQLLASTLPASTPFLKLQSHKIAYADSIYQEAQARKDYRLMAEAYYLYGKIYNAAGDYLTSKRWLLNSLRVLEPRGNSFELGRLYHRLYLVESEQRHFNEAMRFAKLSQTVFQQIGSQSGLMRACMALGDLYAIRQSPEYTLNPRKQALNADSALYYYQKTEMLAHQLKDSLGIAVAHASLGRYLWETNKSPQAIGYLRSALAIYTRQKNEANRVHCLLQLAIIYQAHQQPKAAQQLLAQANALYQRFPVQGHIQHRYLEQTYIRYYQSIGNWKLAFDHAREAHQLELSAVLADRDGAISRLEVEYETHKKEHLLKAQKQEIDLRNAALRHQQNFTVAATALAVLAVGASIVFFTLYRKNQRISRRNEELIKEQNHRVKNNLQVVSSLLKMQSRRLSDPAAKKAVAESQLRIESMAILHRRLYDGDQLAEVDLNQFMQELVHGVLLAYGFPHVRPQFEIDAGFLVADKAVPLGLLLNELTTNACKYAFPYTAFPRFDLRCTRIGNQIELTVSDNGPGLGQEPTAIMPGQSLSATKKSTFGMSLIQAQADQLDATFRFDAASETGGTLFTMTFKV